MENNEKIQIFTENAPAPAGPYSQAIQIGDFIFASGQRPVDPVSGEIPSDIKSQTKQVLTNIKSVLAAANVEMKDIIRTNVYLSDIKDFYDMNEVYKEMIPEPFPARTTVGCQLRGILVEIDVVAKAPKKEN